MTLSVGDRKLRKTNPKNPQTASKRSGNVRGFSAWVHRCFVIRAAGKDWKATNVFPAIAPDVPHTFIWKAREDRDGLKRYIDTLLTGRRSESVYFERAGLVEDIEMFHLDRPEDTNIRVSINRFVDFMTLRDQFQLPLWGKVHFITNGQSVVPIEFLAALGQLLDPHEKKFYDINKDWWHCRESDLQKMGLKPEDITSSMYRTRHAPLSPEAENDDSPVYQDPSEPAASERLPPGASYAAWADAPDSGYEGDEIEDDAPQASLRETEIERVLEPKYADITTLVQPDRGRRYYTRRIMTYEGRMLWVGTSFNRTNWKVWQRDTARLLAFGLDV